MSTIHKNQPETRSLNPRRNHLVMLIALGLFSIFLLFTACEKDAQAQDPPAFPTQGAAADLWPVGTSEIASTSTNATPTTAPYVAPTPGPWIKPTPSPNTESEWSITSVPAVTTPTRVPTESFTVHDLAIEPTIGTAFETLLSRLPDNPTTRRFIRLGDFAGVRDALGLDRLSPDSTEEERNAYFEYLENAEVNYLLGLFISWPSGLRNLFLQRDTFPDMAFNWASVDQFAHSGEWTSNESISLGSTHSTNYDVALGQFDPEKTRASLAACDCDQPNILEHEGTEYFLWGEGDGKASMKDRQKRPFYDFIGRGPQLLLRDGEAYYSITPGVIEEHIEVIQGTRPSLADADGYLGAVQWMASLGIMSDIYIRNHGYTTAEVGDFNRDQKVAITKYIEANPLLLPFDFAARGNGYDGEREFTGLVIVHDDAESAEANTARLLNRLQNGIAGLQYPSRITPWTQLIDRIDIQAHDRFLVARIYFTQTLSPFVLAAPNTLLVHD